MFSSTTTAKAAQDSRNKTDTQNFLNVHILSVALIEGERNLTFLILDCPFHHQRTVYFICKLS